MVFFPRLVLKNINPHVLFIYIQNSAPKLFFFLQDFVKACEILKRKHLKLSSEDWTIKHGLKTLSDLTFWTLAWLASRLDLHVSACCSHPITASCNISRLNTINGRGQRPSVDQIGLIYSRSDMHVAAIPSKLCVTCPAAPKTFQRGQFQRKWVKLCYILITFSIFVSCSIFFYPSMIVIKIYIYIYLTPFGSVCSKGMRTPRPAVYL